MLAPVFRLKCPCVLFALMFADAARAAETPKPESAPPASEYRVNFESKRVEIDPDDGTLELSGDVRVYVDRYRLTSQKLRLGRGPRGVEVEGQGRFAFCPCSDPPLSIGFSSATLAPPTDALLMNPTLRVGNVPVFWLPFLWLRSTRRLGFTMPWLEWRGQDGLLAGSGVHVPLAERAFLQVGGAGYIEGGARVDARLETDESTTLIRWDRLGETALHVQSHGAYPVTSGSFAFRIDALRGARGREALSELEASARRYDRARIGFLNTGRGVLGFTFRGDVTRGTSLSDYGEVGPGAHASYGGAIADIGVYSVWAEALTTSSELSGDKSAIHHGAEARLNARPSVFAVDFALRERALTLVSEVTREAELEGASELSVALPLVRKWGSVAHFISPHVRGIAELRSEGDVERELRAQEELAALTGFETSLGSYSSRNAVSFVSNAGVVGSASEPNLVTHARLTADTDFVAAASELAWLPDDDDLVAIATTRLGPDDGLHFRARAEGAFGEAPLLARNLERDPSYTPNVGWFDRTGWTVGSDLTIPWWSDLVTYGGADYDLSAERLLALWAALRYRHPCACFASAAWVSRRLGRGGFDAWLGVNLAP